VSRTLWRIGTDTPDYEAHDIAGLGAKLTGGRWNPKGMAATYAAPTRALACLETLVHLNAGGLPLNRYLVEIVAPDAVWSQAETWDAETLAIGWDACPPGAVSLRLGAAWLRSNRAPLLVVPSAIIPEEANVVINPAHPAAAQITARKVRRWTYDPRLATAAG
jgi:RES domain-containing protein